MRTIGFYDDSPGHSGTVQYLLELLKGLDRARYAPVVFSPRPATWHDQCRAHGADVITLTTDAPAEPARGATASPLRRAVPRPRWRQLISWARTTEAELRQATRLFRQRRVDILHSNNAGDEVAPLAARRARVPRVVATLHVDPTYDLTGKRTGRHYRWFERRSLQALDVAIAVSQRTADEWHRRVHLRPGHPQFTLVSNGVELSRLERRRSIRDARLALGLPLEGFVVGSLGRLDLAKGYADLLEAVALARPGCPDLIFAHAGRGPLAAELAARSERLGIADRVHWLGFRSDVRDLLEACDLYVQPSWCEAHALSILEAGAMSLPVIATDVGGNAETLAHGEAGWVVPARDPAALAEALVTACHNAEARTRFGAALGERVRTLYQSERMIDQTMAVYDRL